MTATVRDETDEADRPAWHALPVDRVVATLETAESGLGRTEAARRLDDYGPNEIPADEGASPVALFVSQFRDILVYVLVAAATLSLLVGFLPGEEANYVDAVLILAILLANGVFGFLQDYRAERSMAALRDLATPDATVIRDGEKRVVDAASIVPGDVLVIEQGDAIPADARLVESIDLETMEAPLTGESENVLKTTGPLDAPTPLAERSNMVYMNTNAVRGRGRAVVVATGMETSVGGIATQIRTAEQTETPFQVEVNELGRQIGSVVLGLIALVVAVQFLLTRAEPITVLLTAATLAVAAVPEGLPAVVTLTLALGSQRLAERNALVRRLQVVESLGSVDVVLTDKTGTLTENQMTVTRVATGEETYEVTGTGLDVEGEFRRDGARADPTALAPVLRCGAACNNAEATPASSDGEYYGDPTEVALLVAAAKAGVERVGERVREIPFSAERKRMTVVVDEANERTAYVKGAPVTVLERCDRVLVDGDVVALTESRREAIRARADAFASDALRVLGFASKRVADPAADPDDLERELVFLGLQGMIDPPRDGVGAAIAECRSAGIRVVMATGDSLATARAVGEQIGFDPARALGGAAIESFDDAELRAAVEDVEIFARVDPDHKVQILEALQANRHRVAMTGDGVNDAPGLRNADVGIAMGQRGTDVAQAAADVVLRDDDFGTIRDAIAEGRGIFDNVRKFVNYLLSANVGEVLVVFFGVVLGTALFPTLFAGNAEALILTPVMLLWINLVTDGAPALALGADPKAADVMTRPPRPATESVIDRRTLVSIGSIGLLLTVTGLSLFFYGLRASGALVVAQTLLFSFLVAAEMVRIQLIRSRYDLSPVSNRWLLAAVGFSLFLQLVVLYTPLNAFFGVVPLGPREWTWIGGSFLAFVVLGLAAEVIAAMVVES